jgi:hypothetical protein
MRSGFAMLLTAGLLLGLGAASTPTVDAQVMSKSETKPGIKTPPRITSFSVDREELLKGVKTLSFPGVPGEIVVFGDNAFPVVIAKGGGRSAGDYVVAAKVKSGRVIALGHPGMFTDSDKGDTTTFFLNALRWVDQRKGNPRTPLRVGIREGDKLITALRESGLTVNVLQGNEWVRQLNHYDVLMLSVFREEPETVRALGEFVERGGGLLVSSLGWAWRGYHAKPGERLDRDAAANQLCVPFGFAFGPGVTTNADEALSKEALVPVGDPPGPSAHLSQALTLLTDSLMSNGKEDQSGDSLTDMAMTLSAALEVLPPSAALRKHILKVAASLATVEEPVTRLKPAGRDDDRRKAVAVLESIAATKAPVNQLTPAPSSQFFPGPVPKTVKRVKDFAVEIDTDVDGWRGGNRLVWQSTGMYAGPGDVVDIRIPKEATGWGLVAQIGCHTDGIAHHPEWFRPNEITRQISLEKPVTKVGSGYGGLIYILVPPRNPHGSVMVMFSGAVRAPSFTLGKSDVAEWRFSERNLQAPFGELVSDRIILTVQAKDLKTLEHPDKILEQWRKIVDCYADLAGIPFERKTPERFVPDHQISGGWLHSGYPMMAQDLDRWSGRLVADEFVFTTGEWGFFHELGHNHQEPEWTFEGTGEVTCNVFGMYVFDTLFNGSRPHDQVQPAVRERKEREYVMAGRPFDKWKSDPFLALIMYEQMVQEIGWEPFKKVFREYRALPQAERPRTEVEKHDQWMVRMSKACGRNLGPFFEHWAIPTSPEARASIKDLPGWMPKGTSHKESSPDAASASGTPHGRADTRDDPARQGGPAPSRER